jgi:hypothetical protein
MTALLFTFLLIQTSPAQKGFATGIVRGANGAPASGVRVYAVPAGDPSVTSTGATVIESLAQTDASGRYRLEIPAGRYYIAVGSVSAPTYFPDTASIASAKAISIVAGSTIESVDFSRYTTAVSSTQGIIVAPPPPVLPPGSTGVLSGVVRNADGSLSVGTTVRAVPTSILSSNAVAGSTFVRVTGTTVAYTQGTSSLQIVRGGGIAVTDSQGRYRLENVTPDTYNIITGYSDFPIFYPGTNDIQKATAITTTPTTMLTTLDFALSPPPKTFSIRGHVSLNNGRPVGGVTLNLLNPLRLLDASSSGPSRLNVFLPSRNYLSVKSGGDGSFEIPDVVPGQYSLQAAVSGASPLVKIVNVVDAALSIDFNFSITVISGRITWDDGSPFSDSISPVAISTTSNPNSIATTLLPVSNAGTFSSVIESGDYRVYIRTLPSGYVVRSMTIGSVDLSKDTLHVSGDVSETIQIRVAKGMNPGARIQGKVLDATSGSPAAADRVELCCFTTGPFERLSTGVLPGGVFDFPQVPPGQYTAELRKIAPQAVAVLLNPQIIVGDQDKSGLLLLSATQTTPLTAAVTFEDGSSLPSNAPVTLALFVTPGKSRGTSASETTSIEMTRLLDGTYWTMFPTGTTYTMSVGNLPEGYRIKSISRSSASSAVPTVASDGGSTYSGVAPGAITIVLQKTPTN